MPTKKTYIQIYMSLTGKLISSMTYNSDINFLPEINSRHVLINSDGTSAYVFGKYNISGQSSCSGNFLFKYNPSLTQSSPDWQIKSSECKPWGIVFGSKENVLLALNTELNITRITLLDDSGISPS
jgi:hypothetical protein